MTATGYCEYFDPEEDAKRLEYLDQFISELWQDITNDKEDDKEDDGKAGI